MRLHNWHSSSTSFRVRIGLNLKGLLYEDVPVELGREVGDHESAEFRAFNPQANVPVLEVGELRLQQSLAILEYLDRTHPSPPLLPSDAAGRARVWSIALHVACEIQPMNNRRVQMYMLKDLGLPADLLSPWQLHWCTVGFDAIERQLAESRDTGTYCHGETPTIADCCLVPQVYNAQRPVVGADLAHWPTIKRVYDSCLANPAFEAALPANQPTFENPTQH
jgi:maleylacetoacetate isomerase